MNKQRWQEIERLYHAALERDGEAVQAFLADACGGDQELRREVEALISEDRKAKSFIEAPALEVAAREMAGDLLDGESTPTRRQPAPEPKPQAALPAPNLNFPAQSLSASSVAQNGRFIAGAMLAGRYRIVSLLGRGGMGEVYKAEDLKLKQTVALKFLPEAIALDGRALSRFHNEVRVARQVAHVNVCRVYDIGEVEGLHFLTMEFIDGEDLSSLLRRIGRLPGDKAVELARQMCAGLQAAHEAGVLHRDLKPANVMIDGRGKARITDFGLAVVSKELRADDVQAGTPAYMAPEQLTGKEVTPRSDIYALGLVLYELFTGKRVFEAETLHELIELHEKSAPQTPSSHVKDIDPLAERVILRCLEKDPKARPSSAVQVALALPGGDPLAAALAMGETPSPELVAAAGSKTGLRPMVALACLLVIISSLLVGVHLRSKLKLIDVTPFENPPEVLSHKAREIISRLGYPERPTDIARGFEFQGRYLGYVRNVLPAGERWSRLALSQPAPIIFWHRESPQQLIPRATTGNVSATGQPPEISRIRETDPPQMPGTVSVRLDMKGRLIRFNTVPRPFEAAPKGSLPDKADWAGLFTAAGIDPLSLTTAEPLWTPPSACDTQAAWVGTFPEQPDLAMRVEAAAWHGKPVYFEVSGQWTTPIPQTAISTDPRNIQGIYFISLVVISCLAWLLAWRNLRHGRGDRKGAFRVAAFTFLTILLAKLLSSFVPTLQQQEHEIFPGLAYLSSAAIWLLYIALEPYVRRRWPGSLISWSRVMAGNFRDPLVGRDVLIGILFGIALYLNMTWGASQNISRGGLPGTLDLHLRALSGERFAISQFVLYISFAVQSALFYLFLLFLLRRLTRSDWLAGGLLIIFFIWQFLLTGNWLTVLHDGLHHGLLVVALTRYGLVTMTIGTFVIVTLNSFPVTLNYSVWYAGTGLLPLVAILALAVFAFYTSVGGLKVFEGKLLED